MIKAITSLIIGALGIGALGIFAISGLLGEVATFKTLMIVSMATLATIAGLVSFGYCCGKESK
jgi:hypothetical protein